MNRREHLLTILGEECSELQQVCSKTLRFGLQDDYTGISKREWLELEYNDILAMVDMLKENGIEINRNETLITKKIAQVEKYLIVSKEKGTLND